MAMNRPRRTAGKLTERNPLNQPTETVGNTSNSEQPMEESSVTTMSCYDHGTFGVNFPEVNTIMEFSELPCSAELLDYINCSNDSFLVPSDFVLFTQEFLKVAKEIQSYTSVALRGPKGCGKTFILTVLFIFLQKKKPCLYLGPMSFHNPHTKDYFLTFLDCHKSHIAEYKSLRNLFTSCEDEHLLTIVVKLIKSFVQKNELFLFIDFGNITSYEKRPMVLDALMNCACIVSFGKLSRIIAVSCGISVVKRNLILSRRLVDRLYNLVLGSWEVVYITGFTSQEAEFFINQKKTCLTSGEIREVSGTNPLLLSLLNKGYNLGQYSAMVENEITSFLERNLYLKAEVQSVRGFLEMQNWEICEKFIYYAYRGEKMTVDESREYYQTWMYSNEVTIECEEHTLRFNFPGLGLVLIKMFRKFAREVIPVEKLADKHRSVAGFLFEEVFCKHCQCKNELLISCLNLKKVVVPPITLHIELVTQFNYKNLSLGYLYELKIMHAVLDFVGYLQSHDGTKYLVFVQLSLQTYKAHKKLSEIFRVSPSKNCLPDHMWEFLRYSLFDFYYKLIEPKEVDKIVFLYISPEEESTSLLKQLQADLCSLAEQVSNQTGKDIYMGTIPRESGFYSKMQPYIKNP